MAQLRTLIVAGLSGALAACGGGGGGGGTGIVAPPPPAPPAPLSFNGPSAGHGFTNGGGGTRYVYAATTSGAQVTITDPDITSPTKLGDFNFDGDETITVQLPGGEPRTLTFHSQNETPGGLVPYSSWTYSVPNNVTDSYGLMINRPVVGTSGKAATSRYATVVSHNSNAWRSGSGSHQVIGIPSSAADMPVAFNAHYEGLAVGENFHAKAVIDVTTSGGGTPQVSGLISQPSYPIAANWRVQFSGPVSGAGFSGPATVSHDGISPKTGTVVGVFYGPTGDAAAEVGGVWSIPSIPNAPIPAGSHGAFVAGK